MDKIIILEESKLIKTLYTHLLKGDFKVEVIEVTKATEAIYNEIVALKPDAILLSVQMERLDSMGLLEKIGLRAPVIAISNAQDIEGTLKALELGAADYILKPQHIEEYKDTRALEQMLKQKLRRVLNAKNEPVTKLPQVLGGVYEITLIEARQGSLPQLIDVVKKLPIGAPPTLIIHFLPDTFNHELASRLQNLTANQVD